MMLTHARRRFAVAIRLVVVLVLPALPAVTPAPASAQPSGTGEWSPVFQTPNVIIHAHVLPGGKVLFWSRRRERANRSTRTTARPGSGTREDGTFKETPKAGIQPVL